MAAIFIFVEWPFRWLFFKIFLYLQGIAPSSSQAVPYSHEVFARDRCG